jgi:transcriptional regulator with XRE-family HTH domain
VAASNKLKALRNKCNVTVRDVEQASRRIAEAKGDKNYCVSNSWLAQLENGISAPNIWTVFSLCAIYSVTIREFLQLYNVNIDEIEKYTCIANPQLTLLHPNGTDNGRVAAFPKHDGPASVSTLLPAEHKQHVLYGQIGLTDYTLYPLIRPGSVVEIDTKQNKLNVTWHTEFERPIFFVELRDNYACGWCELERNILSIVPHPCSPVKIRRFMYPREAEIVGRVVSYNTRCVDPAPDIKVPLLAKPGNSHSTRDAPQMRNSE